MPDFKLAARSGLEHLLRASERAVAGSDAGVTLALRDQVALATVMARKGAQGALARQVQDAFGLRLPGASTRVSAGSIAFAWAAPDQWLVTAEATDRSVLEAHLRSALSESAFVSNQSDGRIIIRVAGPKARDALAKGVPLDLHPIAFKPGSTAVTAVAHVGVHFWQLDETPIYEFAVFRSFAAALWQFLIDSSEEFGLTVPATDYNRQELEIS